MPSVSPIRLALRCTPRRLLIGMAVLLSIGPAEAGSETPASPSFDRNAWLQDYRRLKTALEQDYANLAWFASPQGGVDLPELDHATQAALNHAENDGQARQAILNFVESLHDGHFSQLPDLAESNAAAVAEPPDASLDPDDAATACAAFDYGFSSQVAFSLPFESLPGFHLQSDGSTQVFRSGLLTRSDGSKIGIVRIPDFKQREYGLCLEAWHVIARSSVPDRKAIKRAVVENWYATLADRLRGLRAAGAALLLVDVGRNDGGNDSGDIAVRLFTDKPVHSARLQVSQSQVGTAYLNEQIQELQHGLELKPDIGTKRLLEQTIARFQDMKSDSAKTHCDLSWAWSERRDWNGPGCHRLMDAGSAGGPLDYLSAAGRTDIAAAAKLHWPIQAGRVEGSWTGPVYVLTDGGTYSAAEMFAAAMQNNRVARVVGSRTGGDGCGFMIKSDPVVLPNSKLRFRMPNCIRLRADGSDEVAGVVPDLPVLATEGESRRARAARVLDTVAGAWQR